MQLDFEIVHQRRWAPLESAAPMLTEARPGSEMMQALLRPYRCSVAPDSGSYSDLHFEGPVAHPGQRWRDPGTSVRHSSPTGRKFDLASTIALLTKSTSTTACMSRCLKPIPEVVADKNMPALPLSIMNVMDGMRGTQEMVVQAESRSMSRPHPRSTTWFRLRPINHQHQIESRATRTLLGRGRFARPRGLCRGNHPPGRKRP